MICQVALIISFINILFVSHSSYCTNIIWIPSNANDVNANKKIVAIPTKRNDTFSTFLCKLTTNLTPINRPINATLH